MEVWRIGNRSSSKNCLPGMLFLPSEERQRSTANDARHPIFGVTLTSMAVARQHGDRLPPLPPHRLTTMEKWEDHHLLEASMERKLIAIFSADVQGYSRLMGDDEEATIRTLTAYRQVMATLITQ